MILSIDTTTEFGSLALAEGTETVEEILLRSSEGFAHLLFDAIRTLLARHGIPVGDIDCFAATSGPGSFTGVRIGLTAAKGLGEATGRPVVAVSNLRVIASFGSAPLRAALLDARRGEIYGAVYDASGHAVTPETVMKFPAWMASLPRSGIELVATDFEPFRAFADPAIPVVIAPRALAGAIGRIAALELAAGRVWDPAAIDANYVRRSDAELFWKD